MVSSTTLSLESMAWGDPTLTLIADSRVHALKDAHCNLVLLRRHEEKLGCSGGSRNFLYVEKRTLRGF